MGVALAVTHSIGDMEPEEATYYIQIGTPVETQKHQPTKLSTQILSSLQKMQEWRMEQRQRECPSNSYPTRHRSHRQAPIPNTVNDTLLCLETRVSPAWLSAWLSSERLHPAADSDRCRHPQKNTGWSLGTLMEEQEEE